MASGKKSSPRCLVCKKSIDITMGYWGRINTIGEQKYWHDSCNAEYDLKYADKDD